MIHITSLLAVLVILLLTSNSFSQSEPPETECCAGKIEVETFNGIEHVTTDRRTLDLPKRNTKADDLFNIVLERMNPAAEQKFDCNDAKLFASIQLLAELKDERVLEPLLEISKSSCSYSCASAVYNLQKLGDRRALPRLFEILRKKDACSWTVVRAIAKVGDETAIPELIDSIPAGGSVDAEERLKAIEEITSLSLDHIREEWGLIYYDKLEKFHRAMYEWWEANKHLAKIKETK